MATLSTEKKMNLKLFIDAKSQKVVFAESGNEFVDFIIHLLQLPLLSVTKILKDKDGMVGCFGALHKSIEELDNKFYEQKHGKEFATKPRTSVIAPLLSHWDTPPTNISFYNCGYQHKQYISESPKSSCPVRGCSLTMSILNNLTYAFPVTMHDYDAPAYVNESLLYIVTDNLEIKPMSISVIRSLTPDFDSLSEKEVEFGQQEGLALLKASLEKDDILTTVFLKTKVQNVNKRVKQR